MEQGDVRALTKWLLDELSKRRATAALQPFGDSPFEVELATALQKRSSNADASILSDALDRAIQVTVSNVLSEEASPTDFDDLVSLALVARYLKVGLDGWGIAETLSFLRKQADQHPAAAEAVASLTRSVTRNGGLLDKSVLEELAIADAPTIRRAAIEALARQGTDRFVPLLQIHLQTSDNNEQLLWTLAHLKSASEQIAQQSITSDLSELITIFRAALCESDPSGEAYAEWVEAVAVPPRHPPRFEAWDWRLSEDTSLLRAA